jgi:hypothetical protein
MVITREQQKTIDKQIQQQYLAELNRLGSIEIEQTSPIHRTKLSIVRRPLSFEMVDKMLASRISKQLDQWPTFSGKLTENVTKWLKDITKELILAKFDDSQKLSVIQTYLIDDARKWFINNMETLDTWATFNEAIKQTYSSTFAMEAAISQVAQRYQGFDETVMHYYNDMMELFDVMDNSMNDLLKVNYLKHGLKLSLKKEVSRKNPLTPSEFITAAQEEENLDYSITASSQNWEIPNTNEIQTIVKTTTRNSTPTQQNYHGTSYPQHQIQNDNENYYARIAPFNKQQQQQQQPYIYQQQHQQPDVYHQQQQPFVYQQQRQYLQQHQQHQQRYQSYPYQTQQRCYICNKSGHFSRDCRYSKN